MRPIIVTGLVLAALTIAQAGERPNACPEACPEACHVKCPRCDNICHVTVGLEKVKRHCYDVECKTICIPRITFPWQIACGTRCDTCCDSPGMCCPEPANSAKLRTVRVLKKFEYECERCKYTWSPTCGECGCEDRR
jgi:hypothetical protein